MLLSQLSTCLPLAARSGRLALYGEPLLSTMEAAHIDTPLRCAHFLAQIAHESGELAALVESLNYSAEALTRVWPSRFPPAIAAQYAHQPERIANRAYANRMGNGDEESKDGSRFKGRGPIQITGRDNYEECSVALSYNLVANPDILLSVVDPGPRLCMRTATWFWTKHALNAFADADDLPGITRRINGGLTGLADRLARLGHIKTVLEVAV